jgi:phage shock protein C
VNDRQRNDLLLVVGIVILLAGVGALANAFDIVPPFLVQLWTGVRTATGPAALVVLGVLVVLYATGAVKLPVMPAPGARLYRSRNERWIAGVCGGIARYLSLDPLLVRALFVLVTLVTGLWTGVFVYIVLAAVVIPEEPYPGTTHV